MGSAHALLATHNFCTQKVFILGFFLFLSVFFFSLANDTSHISEFGSNAKKGLWEALLHTLVLPNFLVKKYGPPKSQNFNFFFVF